MIRRLLMALAIALTLTGTAFAQEEGEGASPRRKAQILENLKHRFPRLAQVRLQMGQIESSDYEGLDQGVLTINGRQKQKFLVSEDNTELYLIAAGPIDVSHSVAELESKAAREAARRQERLSQAIKGLPVRGNPDALVTIVEFADFQCPYCQRGYQTVEELLQEHGDEVKFVFKHFPLSDMHPWAKPAAVAAQCAARQDPEAFWTLHDAYFENQQEIAEDNVLEKSREYLADSGLDLEQWSTCAEETGSEAHQAVVARVEQSVQTGRSLGVSGTPGFFVNGHFLSGAQPLDRFESLIEQIEGEQGD